MEFTIYTNKTQRKKDRIKNSVNQFEKLPNEIVAHIFGFINVGEDLLDCATVSKQFNSVIQQTPNLLTFKENTRKKILDDWNYDNDNYDYHYNEDKYDGDIRYYNKYGTYSYEP
jgi:hypothetical protein